MSETNEPAPVAPAEDPRDKLARVQLKLRQFGNHGVPTTVEEAEAELAAIRANVDAVLA